MSRDAVVFGISGAAFGIIVGWILGSQQAARPAQAVTQTAPQAAAQPQAPVLDIQRVMALEQQAKANPSDPAVRIELGNLYYDAQRCDQAIPWYEAAHKLAPKNVEASTDLAVCLYYTDQPDRALAQIDRSLAIDPRHLKTLLNQGIIRAGGKRDLAGAAESWSRLIQIAPDSPEAARARELQSAHPPPAAPGGTAGAGGTGRGGG
jgi:tetratricopeptide (TPR) repeat protein